MAEGLLFELLGQSAGDPYIDEDDIPVVIRSWQAQNFLVTALHVKGSAENLNVLGITEVQVILSIDAKHFPCSRLYMLVQLVIYACSILHPSYLNLTLLVCGCRSSLDLTLNIFGYLYLLLSSL